MLSKQLSAMPPCAVGSLNLSNGFNREEFNCLEERTEISLVSGEGNENRIIRMIGCQNI
jgi:hypothetical protein